MSATLLDLPGVETPSAAPLRRRRRSMGRDVVFDLLGAALAAVSVSILVFGMLTPLSGPVGFAVVAYVVFISVYAALVSLRDDALGVRDAVMTVVLTSAACAAFVALVLVIGFTMWRGRAALSHLNFFDQDMSRAGPTSPLTVGGVAHAVVGTLWMIGLALAFTVPLGLLCAVYLDQSRGHLARFVRTVVQAMTALPTILAGLFIYAAWILTLGYGFSGLAAALALSIMMLPYIIHTSDLVLRLVPNGLREASGALGAPRWRTVWHVVLPTARSGLATGVILGTARSIGEASPVLLTAGFTTFMNTDPFHGPMVSLPLEALTLVASGEPAYVARGFACATLLLLIVLGMFVLARVIGGSGEGHLSDRHRRRIERLSARDQGRLNAFLKTDAIVLTDDFGGGDSQ